MILISAINRVYLNAAACFTHYLTQFVKYCYIHYFFVINVNSSVFYMSHLNYPLKNVS